MEKVIEGDFTKKLARHKDVRDAFDGVIPLDVTGPGGGKWTADLTPGTRVQAQGAGRSMVHCWTPSMQ